MTRPCQLLLKETHREHIGEGTVRIWDHHAGKGLHSLRDDKVQGGEERERGGQGLWLFLWELWKDPGLKLKNMNSNLH